MHDCVRFDMSFSVELISFSVLFCSCANGSKSVMPGLRWKLPSELTYTHCSTSWSMVVLVRNLTRVSMLGLMSCLRSSYCTMKRGPVNLVNQDDTNCLYPSIAPCAYVCQSEIVYSARNE